MPRRNPFAARRTKAILSPALTPDEALKVFKAQRRVASGKSFETTLAQSHELYERQGVAMIQHLHPETGGGVVRHFKAAAVCDYIGYWRPYGADTGNPWPVAFDAKALNDATMRLPTIDPFATPKNQKAQAKDRARMQRQCQFLIDFTERGHPTALGFLLVFSEADDMGWVLLPSLLRALLNDAPVPLRSKLRNGTVQHHAPHFLGTSMLDMASGRPRIDWRTALLRLHPMLAAQSLTA